jgi:hypothetical protein
MKAYLKESIVNMADDETIIETIQIKFVRVNQNYSIPS